MDLRQQVRVYIDLMESIQGDESLPIDARVASVGANTMLMKVEIELLGIKIDNKVSSIPEKFQKGDTRRYQWMI